MAEPNEPQTTIRHEEVHIEQPRRSGGWWVAGLLAIALAAGAAYLFTQTNQSNLQAARDSGRAEAMVNNALSQAQSATNDARRATADAAASMSAAGSATAERAAQSAEKTAQAAQSAATSVDAAASDASANEPVN